MELQLTKSMIRSWHKNDRDSLAYHANNRNIWLNLRDRFPYPYTLGDARYWLRTATKQQPETNFAIEVDGAAVGGIGFILNGDVERVSSEIGYWLGEQFWGRGIVTEALIAVTDYAFANHELTRIYAGVFEWNLASIRVLEKAGFTFEARLRRSVIKDGKILDQFMYSIVRE